MKLLFNRWSTCLLAIFFTIILIITLFLNSDNTFLTPLLIILSLIGIYNILLETYVALTFISPGKRKVSLDQENWEQLRLTHEGPEVVVFKNINFKSAPLVLLIHGWRSSSSSMLGRAELYLDNGFNVMIMELPGHGSAEGVSKWNAGVSVRNLIHLFTNLDHVCDMSSISNIYLHGHSMGGFIGLRLGTIQSTTIGGHQIERMILESPMTMYEPILDEIAVGFRVPKIIRPM